MVSEGVFERLTSWDDVSFSVGWEARGGTRMSDKRVYEKPALEYVGRMIEQTQRMRPMPDGSCQQPSFTFDR